MSEMTSGRKSSLVAMHHRGKSIPYMAHITGETPQRIRAYLTSRKGFPGAIQAINKKGARQRVFDGWSAIGVYVAPITLAKVKFMEGQ